MNSMSEPHKAPSFLQRLYNASRMVACQTKLYKLFNDHPNEAGETFWQHWRFTAMMSGRLLFSGTVLLIHGLMPFTFKTTAGRQIEIMYQIMRSRIPQARRDELNQSNDHYSI